MKKRIIDILYFSSSKNIGFTGHIHQCSLHLSKASSVVFISGENEQFPGIFKNLNGCSVSREEIRSLDTSKKFILHAWMLKKIIKKYNPRVVHSQTNYQLFLVALLKPFFKFKAIQTIHAFGNGSPGLKMIATKAYLTIMCKIFADAVIFQSQYVEDNFPALIKKSYRLPLGFNGPAIISNKSLSTSINIIYAAKFHTSKNHQWLIETLGTALKNNDWHLILPGDGEELDNIRKLVAARNLEDFVILPGWVDRAEMHKLYEAAHLAVVPSISETLGHNIIEPLSYGIPVISFPVGIAPDIASASPAVKCVPFDDRYEMLKAISNAVSSQCDYSATSKSALDYFQKNLTWEAHVEKYVKIANGL